MRQIIDASTEGFRSVPCRDYLEFELFSELLTKSLIVIAEFDKEIISLVAEKVYKEFVKF